jgi:hypothetical protein
MSILLNSHLEKALSSYSENIDFIPYGDLSKWVVRIRGIDGVEDCFKNAEILIKFDTTKKLGNEQLSYPYNPPTFEILTPNGKFDLGGKVCVSIGEFHKESYKQNLGIAGFTAFLIQALVSPESMGGGIRIIEKNHDEIKNLSNKSRAYNIKFNQISNLRLDINYILLIASKLWVPDPENKSRLIKVFPSPDREKDYKILAKKIIAWSMESINDKDDDKTNIKYDIKKIITNIFGPEALTAEIMDIIERFL